MLSEVMLSDALTAPIVKMDIKNMISKDLAIFIFITK
jgi:hypothetical protein